jgi:YidC/Oxa1 family membrane protein insertase
MVLAGCTASSRSGVARVLLRQNGVNARLFSSLRSNNTLLRPKTTPMLRYPVPGALGASASRSYFWSSAPKPAESNLAAAPVSAPTAHSSTAALSAPGQAVPVSTLDPPTADAIVNTSTTSGIPVDPANAVSDVVPAADSLVDSSVSLANAAATSIGPLQYGDLHALGLTSWWPSGIINWTFEIINTATGMPWFWTIVAGTVFWRIVLVPFTVESLRNSARLLPLQPKMAALREEMKAARLSTDSMAMQRVALKNKKVYDDAGVSMGSMMLMPFIQLPVNLGIFFGVKGLCNTVPQLRDSGVAFLQDLTMADPTYLLPAAAIATMNLQIYLSARDMNLAERPETGHIMNLFRVLTIAGAWVMASFPSGLMLSLFVGSSFTVVQTALLRMPSVRTALRIPIVPKEQQSKLPSFMDSINFVRGWYKDSIALAKHQATQERQRMERRRK